MNRLINTLKQTNTFERLQLTITSVILGLLLSVVISWVQSGFYTDYAF